MLSHYLWNKPFPTYALRAMITDEDWELLCFVARYAHVRGKLNARLAARAVVGGAPLECLERLYVVPWEEVIVEIGDNDDAVGRVLEYLGSAYA